MHKTIILGAAAALVATGYLASSAPSIGAPKPKPAADNQLKFPLDMPRPAKKKGGAELDTAEFGNATDEQRAALDQITDVLGQGYNSLLRQQTGDCVDGIINGSAPSSFQTSYHLSLVKSADQLKEEMSAEASASGSFAGWSAKATAKYATEHSSNANTEFLLVKVTSVASPNVTLHKPKPNITPKDDSPAAREKFFKDCGDQYIRAVTMGGQFVALLKYQSLSEEDRKAFEASFSVSGPAVSVDASYAQKLQAFKSRMQLALDYERVGGEGAPADTSIDAVLKYSLDFQRTLTAKNMVLIGYETEDYAKIRLAAGDYQEQRNNIAALRDSVLKRRAYSVLLDDVKNALFPYMIGDTRAPLKTQVDNEIRQTEAIIARCGTSPGRTGACDAPAALLTFVDDGTIQMPSAKPLPITENAVRGWITDDPHRFKIIGRLCFDGENGMCTTDGISSYPEAYVEVIVNGAASRYSGAITLPRPKPGTVNKVQFRVVDSNYGDNHGALTVVMY